MTYGGAPARARQAGRLLVAAGAFTVINNYLPGAGHVDIAVLNLIGVAACVLGLLAHVPPWHRWPRNAPLVFAPIGFVLIALANRFGGVSDFSYATYFVLVFTWVGLAFPPGTSWLLAPVAAVAYVAPAATTPNGGTGAVSSVTVALPVCLLVAETIARTMRKTTAAMAQATEETERYEQQGVVLREAEERFRLAFDNAPIGKAQVAPDGQFLRVNHALCPSSGTRSTSCWRRRSRTSPIPKISTPTSNTSGKCWPERSGRIPWRSGTSTPAVTWSGYSCPLEARKAARLQPTHHRS